MKNHADHRTECAACGSMKRVELHHRIYKSESGSDEVSNLIPLCHRCHVDYHADRNDFVRWGQRGGKRTAQNPQHWQANLKQYRKTAQA